jgi:hypothetical protein
LAFGDLKKEIPFPTSMMVVSMTGAVINAADDNICDVEREREREREKFIDNQIDD